MEIAINLPEEVARTLEAKWGDVSRRALEAVAAEAYRSGALTAAEVGRLLGFTSRWQTEAFLKEAGVELDYTADDLDHDVAAIRDAR